jgi:hypothetical protein
VARWGENHFEREGQRVPWMAALDSPCPVESSVRQPELREKGDMRNSKR